MKYERENSGKPRISDQAIEDAGMLKKWALVLVVFYFAGTTWATDVDIACSGEGGGIVGINYEVTGSPAVRAFALDITVAAGIIEDICDYHIGESTAPNPGYGIFPGNFGRYITVDPDTGQVLDWDVNDYTPIADPNSPGALGGLGTSGITIEMAALYYPAGDSSPNAPPASGTLCKIKISKPTGLLVSENMTRGGIVLTDPTVKPNVTVSNCWPPPPPPFPPWYSTYENWVVLGRPDCWCRWPFGNGYQCDGDVDGKTETFFKYRIYGKDLVAIVENWKKKIDDPTLNPCADIDHKPETFFKYRVYGKDLAIVVANWKKKDTDLAGDCPRPE